MRFIFTWALLLIVCHSASAQNRTIKDIDGNVYKIIKIGTQVWMAENLKTTHYRDGSPIKEIELKSQWTDTVESTTGAWCYYQSDPKNNPTYGKLYNWYAVADAHHLCPTGWHVPADSEWTVLADYLGGDQVAGGKMKVKTLWNDPNTGADNSSGFTALPAGYRTNDGSFSSLGANGFFWSSTEYGSYNAWYRLLYYGNSSVDRNNDYDGFKEDGRSVRCIGD